MKKGLFNEIFAPWDRFCNKSEISPGALTSVTVSIANLENSILFLLVTLIL